MIPKLYSQSIHWCIKCQLFISVIILHTGNLCLCLNQVLTFEVQQWLCVPVVGGWDRLDPGSVLHALHTPLYGIQTVQYPRNTERSKSETVWIFLCIWNNWHLKDWTTETKPVRFIIIQYFWMNNSSICLLLCYRSMYTYLKSISFLLYFEKVLDHPFTISIVWNWQLP